MNASTLTKDLIYNLKKAKTDFSNIDALHNFYPRIGTGISRECMIKMNKLLINNNLKVCAFVQSNNKKRGPIKEGLPTLEDHRNMDIQLAAEELYALGCDDIFIGDSLPSDDELSLLANVKKNILDKNKDLFYFKNCQNNNSELNNISNYNLNKEVILRIEVLTKDETSLRLLKETYTSRIDEARDFIRTQESRLLLNGDKIEEEFSCERKLGDVTLDNIGYSRYMGELEIILRDSPKDKRINTVARVKKEDIYLLKKLTGGKKFKFEF